MTSITSTLQYSVGKTIKAKVQALNAIGYSVESNPNSLGVFAQSKPTGYVSGLTATTISTSSIYLAWSPMNSNADNGYSTIKNYTVKWNQGATIDTWVVQSTSTSTDATITGLSLGETYSFAITATNIYGDSPDPVLNLAILNSIKATEFLALAPGQMNPIEVNQTGTNVVLYWSNPPSSNGQTPLEFEIKILDNLVGQYVHDTSVCDDTVVSVKTCSIPMSQFTTNYGYQAGDTIHAIGRARNAKGWGPYSAINTVGTLAQTAPVAQASGFTGVGSLTSIDLSWTALATYEDRGYTNTVTYAVYETTSTSNPSSPLIDDLSATSYQITTVTTGETRKFKLKAKNIFGYGPFSSEVSVVVSAAPDQMSAPVVSIPVATTQVKIEWSDASSISNGESITQYKVLLIDSTGTYQEVTSLCNGG